MQSWGAWGALTWEKSWWWKSAWSWTAGWWETGASVRINGSIHQRCNQKISRWWCQQLRNFQSNCAAGSGQFSSSYSLGTTFWRSWKLQKIFVVEPMFAMATCGSLWQLLNGTNSSPKSATGTTLRASKESFPGTKNWWLLFQHALMICWLWVPRTSSTTRTTNDPRNWNWKLKDLFNQDMMAVFSTWRRELQFNENGIDVPRAQGTFPNWVNGSKCMTDMVVRLHIMDVCKCLILKQLQKISASMQRMPNFSGLPSGFASMWARDRYDIQHSVRALGTRIAEPTKTAMWTVKKLTSCLELQKCRSEVQCVSSGIHDVLWTKLWCWGRLDFPSWKCGRCRTTVFS